MPWPLLRIVSCCLTQSSVSSVVLGFCLGGDSIATRVTTCHGSPCQPWINMCIPSMEAHPRDPDTTPLVSSTLSHARIDTRATDNADMVRRRLGICFNPCRLAVRQRICSICSCRAWASGCSTPQLAKRSKIDPNLWQTATAASTAAVVLLIPPGYRWQRCQRPTY